MASSSRRCGSVIVSSGSTGSRDGGRFTLCGSDIADSSSWMLFGEPAGTRTLDLLIKSWLLRGHTGKHQFTEKGRGVIDLHTPVRQRWQHQLTLHNSLERCPGA